STWKGHDGRDNYNPEMDIEALRLSLKISITLDLMQSLSTWTVNISNQLCSWN
ncbi:hypothetical protein KI387_024309, partial [Taxus chinensis]